LAFEIAVFHSEDDKNRYTPNMINAKKKNNMAVIKLKPVNACKSSAVAAEIIMAQMNAAPLLWVAFKIYARA